MLDEAIKSEEASVQGAGSPPRNRRRELDQLLGRLEPEIAELSKTHDEQAQSIAGFAQVAAHEATRKEQNPRLLKLALECLRTSVEEFEATHPRLVQIVTAISNTLASMGI